MNITTPSKIGFNGTYTHNKGGLTLTKKTFTDEANVLKVLLTNIEEHYDKGTISELRTKNDNDNIITTFKLNNDVLVTETSTKDGNVSNLLLSTIDKSGKREEYHFIEFTNLNALKSFHQQLITILKNVEDGIMSNNHIVALTNFLSKPKQ